MADPTQSVHNHYLNLWESQPSPYARPAHVSIPDLEKTSESEPSMACSTSAGITRPIRRLSRVRNSERIPECPFSSRSEEVCSQVEGDYHLGGTQYEPKLGQIRPFEVLRDPVAPRHTDVGTGSHSPFGWAWREKTPEVNAWETKPNTPAIAPLGESVDSYIADDPNMRKEIDLTSPAILKIERSKKNTQESQEEGQEFITPDISFKEQCFETHETRQLLNDQSPLRPAEPIILTTDSDLESLQSVSELDSESESWINEPTTAELEEKLHDLTAHSNEEKKIHHSINSLLLAKYNSLLKKHSHLREKYQSAQEACIETRRRQEELEQSINDVKDIIKRMQEIQGARYEALESQACSVCSQNTALRLDTRKLGEISSNTVPEAGLAESNEKKKDHESLLQAYFNLEEEHQIIKEIRSELEEIVLEQKLAATNAILEKRRLQNQIRVLTRVPNINPFPESPSSPSSTNTTSETIAQLNHKLTLENARLADVADENALTHRYQTEKIAILTRWCTSMNTTSEDLYRELAAQGITSELLEGMYAVTQEVYEGVQQTTRRPVRPFVGESLAETAVEGLRFVDGKGKKGNGKGVDGGPRGATVAVAVASRSGAIPDVVRSPVIDGNSGFSSLVGRSRRASRIIAEAKGVTGRKVATELAEGQREDDYATPGNSDVEY